MRKKADIARYNSLRYIELKHDCIEQVVLGMGMD
jgi:hypothetical protein